MRRPGVARIVMILVATAAAALACSKDEPAADDAQIVTPTRTTPDAAVPDAPPMVDAADAGPCDLEAPFGAPELLPFSSEDDEQGAWPSGSGVFFGRKLTGGPSGMLFARLDADGGYGEVMNVVLPGVADPGFPTLSADGRTLYFRASPVGASSGPALYRATRGSDSELDFGAATALRTGLGVLGDYAPSLSAFGLHYAKVVARSGNHQDYDIRRATLGPDGDVLSDEAVDSLESPFNDVAAQITGDGLRVYFASDRLGVDAQAGYDVWTATRTTPSGPWSNPRTVVELSSKKFDVPVWVSADGCTIFVNSDRDAKTDGVRGTDLYVAKKPAH